MSQTLTTTIPLDSIRPFTRQAEHAVGEGHFRDEGFSLRPPRSPIPISKTRTVSVIATLAGTTLFSTSAQACYQYILEWQKI